MARLPEDVRRFIEEPNFASLATLMPDGSPQVTPMWVDTDGEYLYINTAEGRQKPRNLQHDKRVALAIMDRNNPYRNATVRGRVVEITHQGADAHIDKLAKKYLGQDKYPFRQPGEQRVLVKIEPTAVNGSGLRQ
ncbi:MAG TPA: PPOX class F420-dependent oxidoreductase [Chloroflexota bacterium]|nr:PPOX class F420-dependent oxidoreductase [Chloroflexota bacterium]